MDWLRRNARLVSAPAETLEACLREEQSLEQAFIRDEGKIALHRAMRALPADYRAVLWLVYFEAFPSREAARILHKSARQMKNLLYRARQALRAALEKEGFTYEEL